MVGFFLYHEETEQAEKDLFEVGKQLRSSLGEEANSVVVDRLLAQSNLVHAYDIHGRRRCHAILELYKVIYQIHFIQLIRFINRCQKK